MAERGGRKGGCGCSKNKGSAAQTQVAKDQERAEAARQSVPAATNPVRPGR